MNCTSISPSDRWPHPKMYVYRYYRLRSTCKRNLSDQKLMTLASPKQQCVLKCMSLLTLLPSTRITFSKH